MANMKDINVVLNDLATDIKSVTDNFNILKSLLFSNNEEVKDEKVIKKISLEEVRAILAEISRNGKTNEVRELLVKYGANKLSEIDSSKYPLLLKDGEILKMENKSHVLLSASSSERWLNCTPSARLTEFIEDKESEFAKEGTLVHSLCEIKLHNALYPSEPMPIPSDDTITEEMNESSDAYVSYILELLTQIKETCKDPIVLIEQKLDYSRFVKDGFGTGDCLIVADDTLHIIDYKNRKGIKVESYENPQMKLYALGALEIFDGIYDINKVSMTIFQHRLYNISNFILSKEELYKWANDILKPRAELAYKGEGKLKCGSWCKFCKVKNTCKKRVEEHMKLARFEFMSPFLL